MLAAGREALRNGGATAAPCSGFHHAGYATAEGYCTFNGLMVTGCVLRQEGVAHRVGILDFDEHWGNGTEDIISKLQTDWVCHYSAGATWYRAEQAHLFVQAIPKIVESMRDCDVVLYQAGADPHIDDPLGGWLTTEQLQERDRLVFESAERLSLPVAWNLAGGYQSPLRKVLDIHDNTMLECTSVFG